MTLPYNRSFNRGRQSEQFYNEELHQVFTALKNINYRKDEHKGEEPVQTPRLDGALWLDKADNNSLLKYWDESTRTWKCVFSKKFQITDQINNYVMPSNPVEGQLWIYNDVLMYFNGNAWKPIKASVQDDTQWSNAAFEDYIIVSPLETANTVSSSSSDDDKNRAQGYKLLEKNIPAGGIVYISDSYGIGDNKLEVYLNGIRLVKDLRFFEATKNGIQATAEDKGKLSSCFITNVNLVKNDTISWKIYRDQNEKTLLGQVSQESHLEDYEDNHKNINFAESSETQWDFDSSIGINVEYPQNEPEVDENFISQYVIPNITTDRIFIDNNCDDSYEKVNQVCIKYKTKDIYKKTLSAIHLNPGKLTKITRRLIKIDRQNPSLDISAYNTEFYGFRKDKTVGDFLIPANEYSDNDYMVAGEKVILNYRASQNYDYVLALTFNFTWVKSNGTMSKRNYKKNTISKYVTNLRTPVSIHTDGLMLEEAAYNVNAKDNIFTINEDANDVDIDVWSPAYKEYGYIKETDIEGNGLIHLHNKPKVPIVFIGGCLINPLYGGLNIDLENGFIKVPYEHSQVNMKGMPWCVVDISQDEGSKNIYDFLLNSGTFSGNGNADIIYNKYKLAEEDGILLFVNGLLICQDDYIRNNDRGSISITGVTAGDDYIILKDPNCSIYRHSDIQEAYEIGTLSDALVYLNGHLLCDRDSVSTSDTTEIAKEAGAVHNEVKAFIIDHVLVNKEYVNVIKWRIYDSYKKIWNDANDIEVENLDRITSLYKNNGLAIVPEIDAIAKLIKASQQTDINNITEEDRQAARELSKKMIVYAFRFANANSGIYKVGVATYLKNDEDDNNPIFITSNDPYAHGMRNLNVFKNGIKLVENIEYNEMGEGNQIKLRIPIDETKDIIQYIIEPIENGEQFGYQKIVFTNENSLYPNVYSAKYNSSKTSLDKEKTNIELYPGRISVFLNGLRLPNKDWTILDNNTIMLNYTDYKAISEASESYPNETCISRDGTEYKIPHETADYIIVEIRKDFERQEKTFFYNPDESNRIYIEENEIPSEILDCEDEILIFLNGQYTGLTRRGARDYWIDKYNNNKGPCIVIENPSFENLLKTDKTKAILQNDAKAAQIYESITGKKANDYESHRNKITLVWR